MTEWRRRDGWAWAALYLTIILSATTWARNICPASIAQFETCRCSGSNPMGLDLYCANGSMEDVEKYVRILKGYPSIVIQYLTLKQINMPRIPDHFFTGLDIRSLDLPKNGIRDVPTEAIRHLGNTQFLSLGYNNITALAAGAFEGMQTLETLVLYANSIARIDPDAFRGLGKLAYLNLGNNHLTRVPRASLAKLSTLVTLDFEENRIQSISENDFAGLPNLYSLNLNHNQITVLGPAVFKNLPNLCILGLEYNGIKKVDVTAFNGLEEKLQCLKLGHNHINEIPTEALREMNRLLELDFKANDISELKEDAFNGLERTKLLNLEDNKISSLPITILADMHSLEYISLANNSLRHVVLDVFQPQLENLQLIDVRGNNLSCDCELLWFQRWLIMAMSTRPGKVWEIVPKTMCWTTSPIRQYSVTKAPIEQGCRSTSRAASLSTFIKLFYRPLILAMLNIYQHNFNNSSYF